MAYGFGYDRCGNLTEERRGESVGRQYVYDAAGRMALGKNPEAGEESVYSYNALGMCVGNVRKTAAEGVSRNREVQYVPDYLGSPCSGLMAYETGAGSIRTVFGQGYHRLSQSTAGGRTFFQSDIYGSPLFAADGQGMVLQYAGRGIWGNLKDGTEILPEFVENMGFTSYRYDLVTGKHFAHARFYDDANGRMLAPDPVRRDLNGYRYCGNDPVDYVDPDGELPHILGGALLGGFIGGAGGFISSTVSQVKESGKVNWKKSWGSAANGAIVGAAQGGLAASGVGIPAAFGINFLAGTAGNAAEQWFSKGKVNIGRSILGGIHNAAGNALYGTEPIKNVGDAVIRGMKAGAAGGGLGYLAGLMEQGSGWGRTGNGLLTGMAGKTASAFIPRRDPGKGCGGISPFLQFLGYSSAKGYRYTPLQTGGVKRNREKFSLGGFLGSMLFGAVTGGVSSAAFYGVGKGIERLRDNSRYNRSNVYYHVTTDENAQKIMSSGELGIRNNSWESRVFAWNRQPTRKQASIAGISSKAQNVLKFQTNASFQKDKGNAGKSIAKFVVESTDGQRVPIPIWNVESVGFKKEWWQFWKK